MPQGLHAWSDSENTVPRDSSALVGRSVCTKNCPVPLLTTTLSLTPGWTNMWFTVVMPLSGSRKQLPTSMTTATPAVSWDRTVSGSQCTGVDVSALQNLTLAAVHVLTTASTADASGVKPEDVATAERPTAFVAVTENDIIPCVQAAPGERDAA